MAVFQPNELWLTKVFTLCLGLFFQAPSQDMLGCWGEDLRRALACLACETKFHSPTLPTGKAAAHLCFGSLKFPLGLSD